MKSSLLEVRHLSRCAAAICHSGKIPGDTGNREIARPRHCPKPFAANRGNHENRASFCWRLCLRHARHGASSWRRQTAPSMWWSTAPCPVPISAWPRTRCPARCKVLRADAARRPAWRHGAGRRWAARRPASVVSDVQGNGLFQDLRYHGFDASPLQGTPQGLAVYQNGVRLNEAFGDTVNWDAIPANRHRPHGCVEQQSGVRPQRAGRRGQSW